MDLYDYINLIYDEVENSTIKQKKLTVLHVCSSHLMTTFRKKVKSIFPGKEESDERRIASYIMADLIHATNKNTARTVFENFIKIFGFQKEPNNFKLLIETVLSTTTLESQEYGDLGNDLTKDTEAGKRNSSLYYKFFSDLKDEIVKNESLSQIVNKYYSQDLVNYVLDFLMPYFSLWSAAGIQRYDLARDSNAPVENFFKIFKSNNLENERIIKIPRFMQTSRIFN